MDYGIMELKQMKAIVFDGFEPGCEMKAFGKMSEWLKDHRSGAHKIFGYNIDTGGKRTYDPNHQGYRVLLVPGTGVPDLNTIIEIIAPGTFLVVRAEGTLDRVQEWLPAGWMKINKIVSDQKLAIHDQPRWYEEHIRTGSQDYMIVDLHLELAEN